MSSFDRRGLLGGLGVLALGGCFRPMLAEDGKASALRNRIELPPIEGRFGYYLGESLEDRLGRPKSPEYRLDVRTSLTERGLAVAQNNAVTRVILIASASWALWREGEARPVLQDTVRAQSGHNATASLYATRQTRRDIERRLARDLGERISRAILARATTLES